MSDISDIELMQLADGEGLDSARRAEIEAAVAADPALQSRLGTFQATGPALKRSLDPVLGTPVPQHLIDAIRAAPGPAPSRESSRTITPSVSRVGRIRDFLSDMFTGTTGLVLASIAIAAVGLGPVLVGLLAGPQPGAELFVSAGGATDATGPLAAALDTALSGTATTAKVAGADATIKPVFSFVTKGGDVCRQFEVSLPEDRALAGVGCRDGQRWRIMARATTAGRSGAGTGPAPAGAASPLTGVDEAVDQLKDGNVMTVERERAAMQTGWVVKK